MAHAGLPPRPGSKYLRKILISAALLLALSPALASSRTAKTEGSRYLRGGECLDPAFARGFTSIGCAPCTRAIGPGEPTRAGRWWWETDGPKECGMHCSIETGGLEHELHAILGDAHE